MTRKLAIFEKSDQLALLAACEIANGGRGDPEFVPIWLMMRCGMHPSDISDAKDIIKINGQFIEWRRAKNEEPRRELVPKDVMPRLINWLKKGRKLRRQGYFELVRRVGERVGHPEYSPMSLRHTFCDEMLEKYKDNPDPIRLVARLMGCSEEVVLDNYLSLDQWKRSKRNESIASDEMAEDAKERPIA